METTTIAGKTVGRVGLGTWAIGGSEWGAVDDAESVRTIHAAMDAGINLIDTAPIYGHGRSECVVGRAMKEHGKREDFFIATKAGLAWNEQGVFADARADKLRAELEASLERLGTDFIDLYQVHWPDTLIPVEETAAVFAEFVASGKVCAVGVSNFSVAQMQAFRSVQPIVSNQPPYNLFERGIDAEILPWCAESDVPQIVYSSLCRSLLGGRITRDTEFTDIRLFDPKFQPPRFAQYMTAVEKLTMLAHERFGKSLPELAVRWTLDRPSIAVALWGAKRPEQLTAASGVSGWHIDAVTMQEIDGIIAEAVTDPVGPEYLTPQARNA